MSDNITLLMNTDDDFGTITEYEFSVPAQWLIDHIDTDIDSFMAEYTSDDSMDLYAAALLDGVTSELIQTVA